MEWTFSDWEEKGRDQGIKIRKRPTREEDNIQINCVHDFDRDYPEFSAFLVHCPNEGKRSLKEGARNKHMGVRKGFPDLLLLKSHTLYDYLAIEVKTPTGRPTPEQREYRQKMLSTGGCYCIIRSVEDFNACIKDYISNKDMDVWVDKK